jgi:hypothetical protein
MSDWIETIVNKVSEEFKLQTNKELSFMSKVEIGKALYWSDRNQGEATPT